MTDMMPDYRVQEPGQAPGAMEPSPRPATREPWWKRKVTIAVAAFIAGAVVTSGGADTSGLEARLATAVRDQATAADQNSKLVAERAELRSDVTQLEGQISDLEAALADSEAAIADRREPDAEPAPVEDAKPADKPRKPQRQPAVPPVSVDWSGNLGQFEVSTAGVGRAKDGTFDVVATITNGGDEVDAVYLTATLMRGGETVGVADGAVGFGMFDEFNQGETEAAVFTSADDFVSGVDHVVLEVSFTNKDG